MNKKALVFEPHDDDLIISIGSTVIQLLESDWNIKSVQLTDGRHGSVSIPPEELIKIRRKEKEEEIDFLGIDCSFLDYEDGKLWDIFEERPDEIIEEIKEEITDFDPSIIFLPAENEGHPDHRATNSAVREAVKQVNSDIVLSEYLVWQVPFLNGESNHVNNVLKVNAAKNYRKKKKAIKIHKSQENVVKYSKIAEHYNSFLGLVYSTISDQKTEKAEVLGFENQEDMEVLKPYLDCNDVSQTSHGRPTENISLDRG